ncbi:MULTISPECIES: hypothetical protein [unclassified Pseudoalteromonas]|nr:MULTISPECIES: hypothetical protein [unclassified Pseudoalteromonas]
MNTFSIPSEWISKPFNVSVICAGGTGYAFLSKIHRENPVIRAK